MKLRLYLAGRITGLVDKGQGWRKRYIEEIGQQVEHIEYAGPVLEDVDEDDYLTMIRRCAKSIQSSDVVVVNAAIPFAMGAPMELVVAKYFNKLVITIAGKESPYYEEEYWVGLDKQRLVRGWIHPWLRSFSDYIVASVAEAAEIMKRYQADAKSVRVKTLHYILGIRLA